MHNPVDATWWMAQELARLESEEQNVHSSLREIERRLATVSARRQQPAGSQLHHGQQRATGGRPGAFAACVAPIGAQAGKHFMPLQHSWMQHSPQPPQSWHLQQPALMAPYGLRPSPFYPYAAPAAFYDIRVEPPTNPGLPAPWRASANPGAGMPFPQPAAFPHGASPTLSKPLFLPSIAPFRQRPFQSCSTHGISVAQPQVMGPVPVHSHARPDAARCHGFCSSEQAMRLQR